MLVKLEDISKAFHTEEIETRALQNVSVGIERGEFLVIEGPSGCGKSTLLSVIGLLDRPTSGHYWLGGRLVSQLSSSARAETRGREIGFIFQSFNLISDLTVVENVELPLIYRGIRSSERRRRAAESLLRVDISHRAKHYPAQLSGGQQQRVAVARAIVGDPRILLADEPTGNLDSANGEAVMRLLCELHQHGSTIVMVTHDSYCARFADRKIQMRDGRIQSASESAVAR